MSLCYKEERARDCGKGTERESVQSKWCGTSQRRIGKIGSWERRRVGARGGRCEKIDGVREGEGKRCRCNISLQLTALVRL